MDGKHRTVQLLSIVAVIWGCLLGVYGFKNAFYALKNAVSGHTTDFLAGMRGSGVAPKGVLFFAFAVLVVSLGLYLTSVGLGGLSWAKGMEGGKVQKVKWGRVLLGSWLILTALVNVADHFYSTPNRFELKPSNQREANAMEMTRIALTVLMPVLGSWLLISGIRAKFDKRLDGEESS